MPSPEKISGYQLAEHLLAEGGVEALIRYAGNAETDWLELKAGMCLLPEDKKKGETENDLYWNIAKEVIALMNTSGGALVIGVHDKTLNLVPLENNDPRHMIAAKGIDGYIREVVRLSIWPSTLSWSYYGKSWELTDKQFPADLISYHHPRYTGPDGHSGEVVVLLIKPIEKIRLARKERMYFALFKRTRGEVGEAQPVYDPEVIDEYKASREIVSERYANIRDQFDGDKAATSESATMVAAIKEYYNELVEKSRRMRAVFTSLDAEENVFSKDDVDQFYSPEAIETFDDEDWLDDDDENEKRENNNQEEGEDSDVEEESDEDSPDNDDDVEDRYDERTARKGDLLELLKSEHRVIVSGEPGGGKTTCLTYFTLKFAECENERPVLAVFIPMGQWRRGGSLSIMMERATGLNTGQIARLMEENRLRLVIDAVNECPDEFRVAAILDIGMFLAAHPNIPAVISTRHPKELSSLQLPVFHVQPMDETHRLHYLERYLADGERAQKLLRQLGSMPGGDTIAENPMLLRLVVEVYKSPEKRLPNGRAGLYRRSLRAWYKRENEKAEEAGRKQQWNRRQTFELLAVLAFKSRQRGYRDVPLEEISAIWGDDAENQLEALCQGPIIYCDEEFVRFRHETFQEYLCAEYLVAHQDELPAWTQADYAQWGMPFAYAVELFELDGQQLPEAFWLAAWSLNPWLGVALTDENKGRQLLSPRYHGTCPMIEGKPLDISSRTPYLRAVCYSLSERSIRYALGKDTFSWYMHEDVALRYVIFVSTACQSRWNCFETSQLQCLTGVRGIQQAIKLSKSWITLSNPRHILRCHAPDNWNAWIENASPSIAELLVEAKIALPDDFCEHKSQWSGKISQEVVLRLFSKGVLDLFDIEKMSPSLLEKTVREIAKQLNRGYGDNSLIGKSLRRWISEATPRIAVALIKNGLATKEGFKARLSEWASRATPQLAVELIEVGLMSPSDFYEHLSEWLKDKSISSAILLARAGLASRVDFECVLQKWVSCATPQMAADLVKVGLMSPLDFASRLSGWLKDKSIPFAIFLARAGLASRVDFECVLQKWVSYATPQMAADLVKVGLMSPSDFTSRLSGWLQHPQYSFVQKYLKVSGELENVRGESALVHKWIVAASIDSAELLIDDGLATSEDFANIKNNWLAFSNPSLKRMEKLHLIDKRELTGLMGRYAAMKQAVDDVKNKIRLPMDFAFEKGSWIESANLNMLFRLIQVGIVRRKDIEGLINQWICSATPQSALCLLNRHFAEPKDFTRCMPGWMPLLEPIVALRLIKQNIINKKDIEEIVGLWRVNVEPETLPCAVQLGYMTLDEAVEYLETWGAGVPEYIQEYFHNVSAGGRRKRMVTIINKIQVGQVVRGKVKSINLIVRGKVKSINLNGGGQESVLVDARHRRSRRHKDRRSKCHKDDHGVIIDLVDFNGVDGLLRSPEISSSHIEKPDKLLKIGQAVDVKVIGVDYRNGYILLDLKQMTESPWITAVKKLCIGSRVIGKVVKFADTGAFVEIAPGIEGFVDISEFSWTKHVAHPNEMLNIGDEIYVYVVHVDMEKQKITLSIRQTVEDPWNTMQERHPVGSCVRGRVRCFTDNEACIVLEDGIDGMIHVSEMSWKRKIHHPFECLQIRQEITAVVLNVDPQKRVIALSLKQLQRKFVSAILSKYTLGTVVVGQIIKLTKGEAFVELEPGIEGMIHVSEIGGDQTENVKDMLNIGDEVTARIVKIDSRNCKIHLSINALSMTDGEVNKLKNSTEYRNMDLFDPIRRMLIEHELKSVCWDMTISSISDDRSCLFFSHPSFKDGVRCAVGATRYRDRDVFEVGQMWNVKVCVKQNKEDGSFVFVARSVKPTEVNPACAPRSRSWSRSKSDKITIKQTQEKLPLISTPDSALHLSIYIDETWPGTHDHTYKNVGVIGGVVVPWEGVDEKRLPVIKTHLDNGSAARKAIQTMLGRSEVFPFVFPIKWDHAVGAGGWQYFELVQHALMLLLGWMLPQRNQPTTVDIFLEHISGYMDGHDETDFISSLTQAMRLLSGGRRFVNWQIRRVEWVDKEFGYVPYGDLVCKTCVPREEQQLLAREVKVREWEGFLPFFKDVFPLLRDMDTASPSGLADLLISFAKVAEDTPFFRRVRKIAIDRAKSDATFRDAVISRFEECYAQPERDMVLLNRVVPHFLKEFPPDLFKERPRMQLLRILIGFQHANHNGNPDLASALVEQYHSLRPRILGLDRDLCAYADLNLAVHHHDSFAFDTALSLVDGWINDPLFPALSVMNRGRMFSSRGQSLALLGRNEEADGAFARALSVFSAEPELLAQDIAQTKTYQAMNALDHDAPSAVPLIESILGKSLVAAALDFEHVLDAPFVAHLFLKALWRLRTERSGVLDTLLKNLPADLAFRKQHPYELILFYLALLTKDANPSFAKSCAREVEQFFEAIECGGTLGLIHSYMRVMLKSHGFDVVADKDFFDELDIVMHYLPKARALIDALRAGWLDSAIPIEGILPFNYC